MRPVSGVTAGSCEVVHDVNAYGWVVNAVAADCSDPALAAEAERAVSLWAFGPRNAYNRITPACGVRTRIAYPLR
jgi:hypothetical protein